MQLLACRDGSNGYRRYRRGEPAKAASAYSDSLARATRATVSERNGAQTMAVDA